MGTRAWVVWPDGEESREGSRGLVRDMNHFFNH